MTKPQKPDAFSYKIGENQDRTYIGTEKPREYLTGHAVSLEDMV